MSSCLFYLKEGYVDAARASLLVPRHLSFRSVDLLGSTIG